MLAHKGNSSHKLNDCNVVINVQPETATLYVIATHTLPTQARVFKPTMLTPVRQASNVFSAKPPPAQGHLCTLHHNRQPTNHRPLNLTLLPPPPSQFQAHHCYPLPSANSKLTTPISKTCRHLHRWSRKSRTPAIKPAVCNLLPGQFIKTSPASVDLAIN